MALPLVVLAVLAFFGGVLDLPVAQRAGIPSPGWRRCSARPSTRRTSRRGHSGRSASSTPWWRLVGLGVAFSLWSRRVERPELEPAVLQRAYYLDDIYDAVIARPGQAFATFCATVIEAKVIDGAVNGVGRLTRAAGGGLRRVQTGYVRQYALGIVLGTVVLLAWMISRAVS